MGGACADDRQSEAPTLDVRLRMTGLPVWFDILGRKGLWMRVLTRTMYRCVCCAVCGGEGAYVGCFSGALRLSERMRVGFENTLAM